MWTAHQATIENPLIWVLAAFGIYFVTPIVDFYILTTGNELENTSRHKKNMHNE
jgi:hypothetical protein